MSAWAGWLNAETMKLMGMALLHFLWQGLAIGAMAFLGMATVRRAAGRYVVGVAMLAAMVMAPVVTVMVLAKRQADSGAGSGALSGTAEQGRRHQIAMGASTSSAVHLDMAGPEADRASSIYLLWMVQAWFVGVVLLSLRPAAGFLLIERMRLKHGSPVSGTLLARCAELQRRLGVQRVVRYCESLQVEAPAVVGWFRPVVLLPVVALTGLSSAQLEAVIAHELAHVKRLDAFVNLFQIAAETLLFYHPAVWGLSKRVRAERENCCDDVATAVCGSAVEYARALARMAEWQSAPVLAMAANRSPLTERVARLLGVENLRGGIRSAGIAGSLLCLCASVLAGNVLLGAAPAKQAAANTVDTFLIRHEVLPVGVDESSFEDLRRSPRAISNAASQVTSHVALRVYSHTMANATNSARMQINSASTSMTQRPTDEGRDPVIVVRPGDAEIAQVDQKQDAEKRQDENNEPRQQESKAQATGSYIDAMKAEGLTDLSVDELIALKIQKVTPEYVHRLRALGVKPDANELVAMKVQGVTPELVSQLRVSGFALYPDQIIAMRVQGITPEYIKQLHEMGMEADASKLIAMKVQGITGEYVRQMRAAAADAKLDGSELVAMKIQGITPEYVQQMKALGMQLNPGELIGMKVQGVTAEYIKELEAAGLRVDAGQAMAAKIQGITPGFVENARKHGFQNLSIQKLITLKNSGVLE